MTSLHSAVLRANTQEPGHTSSTNLTFISIHDLSPEARILYSSESILDVLGYTPDQVVNRSIWDFFPAEELPYAQEYHKNGIEMDKAAMLVYCRVRDSEGEWVGCECCFTIVYDVMVVCTSVYRSGMSSQKRALEAPVIRRMFSSSPLDPRYHMLSHISQKFRQPTKQEQHEPRAALFLNRFTRTLTIMYATSGIQEILGISSLDLQGRSFYYCIAERCLADAVRCLENAKGNDSIAYMRFWFRDPRPSDPISDDSMAPDDSDEDMATASSVDQDMEGGVHLAQGTSSGDNDSPSTAIKSESSMDIDEPIDSHDQSRTSSGDSMNPTDTHEAIFGTSRPSESSASSTAISPERPNEQYQDSGIELEAVISCASDGLVVCLRRARPMIPSSTTRQPHRTYENGLFAAPWADEPLIPPIAERPSYNLNTGFAPSLGPHGARQHIKPMGTDGDDFMTVIREQAVFAWALTGINGSLNSFASGIPIGESVPSAGIPIWQSEQSVDSMHDSARTDSASSSRPNGRKTSDTEKNGAIGNDHRGIFGDPGIKHRKQHSSSGNGLSAYTTSPVESRSPTDTRSSHSGPNFSRP